MFSGEGAEAVGEQLVVHRGEAGARVHPARRVDALRVAQQARAERLVERAPVLHSVAERLVDVDRVVAEAERRVPVHPAAAVVFNRLREVPVVQREPRLDACAEQFVDEAAVEVEAQLIDLAITGLDAGPAGGEPVRTDAELLHERHVRGHAVVVVVCDLGGVAVVDGAGNPGEAIPDRVFLAVFVGCALDLRCGGCRAPDEGARPCVVLHSGSLFGCQPLTPPAERPDCQ
jgi:hypothetical protein